MKILKTLFLAASLIGFFDAAYLTIKHFQGEAPNCLWLTGCDIVAASEYAVLFGIPIALLGAIYYLSIFVLAVIYLDTKNTAFVKLATALIGVGMFFSLGLVYLQLFVLKALCLYCLMSAAITALLLIVGILILKKSSRLSPLE